MNREFLYWFRDNKARPLENDIAWACHKFQEKTGREPVKLLVNPKEVSLFSAIEGLTLEIEEDRHIAVRYLGVM